MAIIVQNNAGTITNANSYADTTFVDDYFSLRGESTWTALSTQNKEIALIKAWQYIDTAFNFQGYQKTDAQNTTFPRLGVYSQRGTELSDVETNIKNAQAEYALISLTTDFTINQVPSVTSLLKKESRKADVLSESLEYDTDRGQVIKFSFPKADFWLKEFLRGNTFKGYY